MQRGRGQRAQVGPVVEAAGQEALWVEALEVGDAPLQHEHGDNVARVTGEDLKDQQEEVWKEELLRDFVHLP